LYAALVDAVVDAQVTFGEPAGHEEQVVVALMGVLDPTEEAAQLGDAERHEDYRLEVVVKAHDPTGDPQDVDARGWELADMVRAVVRADRTLGGALVSGVGASVVSMQSDGVRPATTAGNDAWGWVVFIRILVRCRGRAQ
ncbi:MAG: hypothetical protein ACRD2W_18380, partial [Acidimicrobiales bacterium]